MKSYHKNPRVITDRQLTDLERWLRELGDLSGIVHDLNSDEIVSGNQRSEVFDINECDIQLASEMAEPDDQGTVALGYIIWEDQQYAYRAVRWTPEQCEQANIVANRAGGTWDFDILAGEFNTDSLLDWGFAELELGIQPDIDYDEMWKGMPGFEQEDLTALYIIKVHLATVEDLKAFAELLDQTLTEKTRSIWYPKAEIARFADKRWVDES